MTRLPTSRLAFLILAILLLISPKTPENCFSLTTYAHAEESAVEIDPDAVDGNDKCNADKKCGSNDADTGNKDEGIDNGADNTEEDVDVSDDDKDDDEGVDAEDEEEKKHNEDKPAVIDPEGSEGDTSYKVPESDGAVFFDSFQADELRQWVYTSVESYDGEFAIGQGKEPALKGDRALIIPRKARKYGLSAKINGLIVDKPLVVQYEVKMEDGHTCGGAYVKLPLPDFDQKRFDGETPYSVMFGPDKCGATDKVHFIFQSEHPESGKRREHHLIKAPSLPITSAESTTNLYTLIVHPDMEFEVRVNGERKANGTLMDSFKPAVQMPEKISDPEDKKPKDWIDAKKIPDPDATKPHDWDENAPREIVDEDVVKPEGWLDEEPEKIVDPKAEKPGEWDEDEDGEWEAPLVPNPKCSIVGCGEWKKPMKPNPAYKGKWSAPLIDNPEYIGEWKAREIDNPEYYNVDKVELLPVGGVAFELWTMDQGVLFDNIWVGNDVAKLESFTEKTYGVKKEAEKKKAQHKREKLETATEDTNGGDGDEDEPRNGGESDETEDGDIASEFKQEEMDEL